MFFPSPVAGHDMAGCCSAPCSHCGHQLNETQLRQCGHCQDVFCSFCSVPSYEDRDDRVYCLDCHSFKVSKAAAIYSLCRPALLLPQSSSAHRRSLIPCMCCPLAAPSPQESKQPPNGGGGFCADLLTPLRTAGGSAGGFPNVGASVAACGSPFATTEPGAPAHRRPFALSIPQQCVLGASASDSPFGLAHQPSPFSPAAGGGHPFCGLGSPYQAAPAPLGVHGPYSHF